jgi:hypothetical protein
MMNMNEHWSQHDGYSDYKEFPNGNNACIQRLMFTHAILSELTTMYHGDRWCYHNYEDAKAALDAWNGEGEPTGWHRHPTSGRRRPEGDPAKEYKAM